MFLVTRPFLQNRSRSLWLIRPSIRQYANKNTTEKSTNSAISASENHNQQEISTEVRPLGERIKENTKTASYLGVIAIGAAVTGVLFYAIFKELWSSNSPNNVYSAALDKCVNDHRIQDALGAPIKGYGEETRRRRRQHVAHQKFEREGVPHMRMQFYIQGIRNKATVHLEVRQNSSGKYDFRYLFAQLDHYPRTTIILEDNRLQDAGPLRPLDESLQF